MSTARSQHGDRISPLFSDNLFSGGEAVTGQGIQRWILEGIAQGASHTIIWCDTYDHSDYPQHVMPEEDVKAIIRESDRQNMRQLMEVYWLGGDLDEQLSARRSMTFGPDEK